MRLLRPRDPGTRRLSAGGAAIALAAGLLPIMWAAPASATSPCPGGSTPPLNSTVVCNSPGVALLTVPTGTTSVTTDVVAAGGGAGYPARQHIGGDAAEVTGTLTLPTGTAYLYVIVGTAGTGDNHGTSSGGGASAVLAEDAGHNLLAKLVIAGGGGGGAYNGDGGNAGSPGTSDDAQATSGPGGAGSGATGGAGGTGNYAPGTAGDSDNASALSVAAGGTGGALPGGAHGGGGAGGYGGGGGGGGSTAGILSSNVAGGGGGSSLASAYLGSASIAVKPGTGGIQLPGLVAGDGTVGNVTLTFAGASVPGAPTGVSATAGNQQASVSFTAPASDGGSPVTSYTVTSSPGGVTATCPGSPCVITGLTNGTSYTFTVHATNTNGDSAESAASSAITPASLPGAPTAVSAMAGAGQASVSFTAPASDGGSPITSYTVTSSPGGLTATCPGSPCVITGLTNGTAYTFTVIATNAIGNSTASSPSSSVTPVSTPDAPTGVSASPGDGQSSVSFTAPASDGGSAVTSYTVTSSPGGVTATCPGSPCVITGLTNGTSYTFTVHATNTNGDSAESAASSAITPASLPGAPTAVSVTAGAGQASVSFTAPASDGGSPITSYTVTSSPGGVTATCPGSPCVITGLTNGTAYTFTVIATNAIGNSTASSPSSSVTPVSTPDAPTGVSASPGDGQSSVSFTAPASDGGSAVTSYTVTSSPGGVTATCPGSPCVITGLTNGTSYTFTVHATNTNGDSAESAASSAITPASLPGAPTAVSVTAGAGQASVSFTAPASDGGSPITSYTVTSSPGGLTATCPGSPCVITGLTNGTAYTFTVHATNRAGDSAESVASVAVTPQSPPAAVGPITSTTTESTATLTFAAPGDGGSPITGYEYSLDGGTTWHMLTTTTAGTSVTGTITGLESGTDYSITVRAVNVKGGGASSDAVPLATLPFGPRGATATAGTSSVTVSWQPSSSASVTGYTVFAHPGPATCTASSTQSSCVIGATAGIDYTYTVVAHTVSAASRASGPTGPAVATAPALPATVPLGAATTLTTTDGAIHSVTPGQQVTLVGKGFLAYSSVEIGFYSTPTALGSVVTDRSGHFVRTVTVPKAADAGDHNLVAAGVDPTGATYRIRLAVTVATKATPSGSTTTPIAAGTGTGDGNPTAGALASTGAAPQRFVVWGTLIIGAGLILTVSGSRRRRPGRDEH